MKNKVKIKNKINESKTINKITVCGFKSLNKESSIELKPLTILAGANSSGKSSIMQPLLLLKQTLEASYDPGALLLNGPEVKFTSTDQLLSRINSEKSAQKFFIQFHKDNIWNYKINFVKAPDKGIELESTEYKDLQNEENSFTLYPDDNKNRFDIPFVFGMANALLLLKGVKYKKLSINNTHVIKDRFFFNIMTKIKIEEKEEEFDNIHYELPSVSEIKKFIRRIIHVPCLRGNSLRTYNTTSVENVFQGTFEVYTASIIHEWQKKKDDNIKKLNESLEILGLTWQVEAKKINDTQLELQIPILPEKKKSKSVDFVNIADVGFGVSQILPVVVSLLVAEPEQIVYIEQPEVHLHPKAITRLPELFARAAKRGVIVVVETHSSLILRGIQSLIAKEQLEPEKVKLHWFTRNKKDGSTAIDSADLDKNGAFGNWPSDFDDVILDSEQEYLDAVEKRTIES